MCLQQTVVNLAYPAMRLISDFSQTFHRVPHFGFLDQILDVPTFYPIMKPADQSLQGVQCLIRVKQSCGHCFGNFQIVSQAGST